ncbi:MAG: hypothetical protein ABSB57_02810 [Dehalococcoidia bacterium]
MKIESRPVHGSPWQYRFYLDLQAARGNEDVEAALKELEEQVVDLRILGCYAAAQMPGGAKGGRRVSALGRFPDLMPTLLALQGKPVPANLDGRPLVAPPLVVRP